MQHIINVAFDFDDKKISEYIEKDAKRDILEQCCGKVMANIERDLPMNYRYSSKWKELAESVVGKKLDECKDDIIDLAALTLAMRTGSKKKWKQMLAEAKAELGEGE